jgi:hypothetical protein
MNTDPKTHLAQTLETYGISWSEAAEIGQWALAHWADVAGFIAGLPAVARQPFFSPQWRTFNGLVNLLAPSLDAFPLGLLEEQAAGSGQQAATSEAELHDHLMLHGARGMIGPAVALQVIGALPQIIQAVMGLWSVIDPHRVIRGRHFRAPSPMSESHAETLLQSPRQIRGAFGSGAAPVIACVNFSTKLADADFQSMVAAAQEAWNEFFAPVWGIAGKLHIVAASSLAKGQVAPPGMWCCAFWDNADEPGALGYHDLTQDGWPLSHIFVATTIADGSAVSVTFTHELWEMLVDPGIQLWATNSNSGQNFAYETADAVEETDFLVNGVAISNFVYPAYFEDFRQPGSTKFDHLGKVQKPFQILPGGYSIVEREGQSSQIFGSPDKTHRFAREDRRLHRTEFRLKKLPAKA